MEDQRGPSLRGGDLGASEEASVVGVAHPWGGANGWRSHSTGAIGSHGRLWRRGVTQSGPRLKAPNCLLEYGGGPDSQEETNRETRGDKTVTAKGQRICG